MKELYDIMENIKDEVARKADSGEVDLVNSNLSHFVRKSVFLDLSCKVDGKADRSNFVSALNNIELLKAQCAGVSD